MRYNYILSIMKLSQTGNRKISPWGNTAAGKAYDKQRETAKTDTETVFMPDAAGKGNSVKNKFFTREICVCAHLTQTCYAHSLSKAEP